MAVPDPEFCRQWGASAFVIDVEMYTTLNPSTSFVTQPALQPGCVIRRENWTVLQKQGAISNEDVSCLLYTSPSPRDLSTSRMPSSA